MEFKGQVGKIGVFDSGMQDVQDSVCKVVDRVDGKCCFFLQGGVLVVGSGMLGMFLGGVWVVGLDKLEKEEVKIGFIFLIDCVLVVMVLVLGFDKKYGIKIVFSKEVFWVGVCDKFINGELDVVYVLYGLIYGV